MRAKKQQKRAENKDANQERLQQAREKKQVKRRERVAVEAAEIKDDDGG